MREFRAVSQRLQDAGVVVLGASTDDVASHAAWSTAECLPYDLLADSGGELAAAFGVRRKVGPMSTAKRVTFIIGPDGNVARVFSDVDPRSNAGEVVDALTELGWLTDDA